MRNTLISLLAFILPAGTLATLKRAEIPVPWWADVLILLLVWWASLTAGIAWITSRSALVKISELKVGPGRETHGVFFLSIKNEGPPVKIIVTIPPIPDPRGGDDITESTLRPLWRGQAPDASFDGDFAVNQGEQVGLLGIFSPPDRHPFLGLWYKDDMNIAISRDVPLANQDIIRFQVSVNMRTTSEIKEDRPGKTELLTFAIAPDTAPGAPYLYKIVENQSTAGAKSGQSKLSCRFLYRRFLYLWRRFQGRRSVRRLRGPPVR